VQYLLELLKTVPLDHPGRQRHDSMQSVAHRAVRRGDRKGLSIIVNPSSRMTSNIQPTVQIIVADECHYCHRRRIHLPLLSPLQAPDLHRD